MSLKARLAKLEAELGKEAVVYPPFYTPPQHIDPGVQSDMAVAVRNNPAITDAELRAMADGPDFYGQPTGPNHPASVAYAVIEARETAAFWAAEAEREELRQAAGQRAG